MLFFERISLLVRTYHPAEGIDKQKILCGVNEFFIAMSHIQIYHSVFGIGPYDGEITEVHYIFDAQGIVLGERGTAELPHLYWLSGWDSTDTIRWKVPQKRRVGSW